MKWLRLLLAVLLLVCLSIPVVAQAANPVVTIHVFAWVVGQPSGLVITYVSDYQVDLEWVKGEAADKTMVRAKYGSMPASRTDGYEVYYGTGAACSDTGVNFDESASTVYYRLFSQNAAGAWEKEGISGFLENPNMLLGVLFFVALTLVLAGIILKKGYLVFSATAAWVVTSFYTLSRSAILWDIYYYLFILCIAFALTSIFIPWSFREKKEEEEEEDADLADLRRFNEEQQRERNQYGFLYGNRRPRHRSHNRGSSLYR